MKMRRGGTSPSYEADLAVSIPELSPVTSVYLSLDPFLRGPIRRRFRGAEPRHESPKCGQSTPGEEKWLSTSGRRLGVDLSLDPSSRTWPFPCSSSCSNSRL